MKKMRSIKRPGKTAGDNRRRETTGESRLEIAGENRRKKPQEKTAGENRRKRPDEIAPEKKEEDGRQKRG